MYVKSWRTAVSMYVRGRLRSLNDSYCTVYYGISIVLHCYESFSKVKPDRKSGVAGKGVVEEREHGGGRAT